MSDTAAPEPSRFAHLPARIPPEDLVIEVEADPPAWLPPDDPQLEATRVGG